MNEAHRITFKSDASYRPCIYYILLDNIFLDVKYDYQKLGKVAATRKTGGSGRWL